MRKTGRAILIKHQGSSFFVVAIENMLIWAFRKKRKSPFPLLLETGF